VKQCAECLEPGVWEMIDNDGNEYWLCEKHNAEYYQERCSHEIREENGERWCEACHKEFDKE